MFFDLNLSLCCYYYYIVTTTTTTITGGQPLRKHWTDTIEDDHALRFPIQGYHQKHISPFLHKILAIRIFMYLPSIAILHWFLPPVPHAPTTALSCTGPNRPTSTTQHYLLPVYKYLDFIVTH